MIEQNNHRGKTPETVRRHFLPQKLIIEHKPPITHWH